MAGFSDASFRQICKKNGADVLYSEMASATALFYSERKSLKKEGQKELKKTLDLLSFEAKKERYFVAQLFGSSPEHFALATKIVTERVRPDGIDINFGCPVPKIAKQGAGAFLMRDLELSRKVIESVLANTDLPVSVKIRLESGNVNFIDFLKNISDLPIAALMIHGRTLKQGFIGPADFKLIKKARKYFSGVIIANGGIYDLEIAKQALKESGADGLGLARGVLARPWLFKEIKEGRVINKRQKSVIKLLIEHAELSCRLKKSHSITELRKNICWYLKGLDGAAKLRSEVVKAKTLKELKKIFNL